MPSEPVSSRAATYCVNTSVFVFSAFSCSFWSHAAVFSEYESITALASESPLRTAVNSALLPVFILGRNSVIMLVTHCSSGTVSWVNLGAPGSCGVYRGFSR